MTLLDWAVALQMMQDWLTLNKLDRKALAVLSGNAQAVQMYQDYLQISIQDVVEDILSVLDPSAAEDTGMHSTPLVNTGEQVADAQICTES